MEDRTDLNDEVLNDEASNDEASNDEGSVPDSDVDPLADLFEYFEDLNKRLLAQIDSPGPDVAVNEEVKQLKRLLSKSKYTYKIIVDVDELGPDSYIRYFDDGSSDKVNFSELESKVRYDTDPRFAFIEKALNNTLSPLAQAFVLGELKTMDGDKEIETASEKLFFG